MNKALLQINFKITSHANITKIGIEIEKTKNKETKLRLGKTHNFKRQKDGLERNCLNCNGIIEEN